MPSLSQETGRITSGDPGARKLSVALVYGEFSSAIHGPFDFAKLGESALTGSEGSFFNLARSLAERGHNVVVLAPAAAPHEHESGAVMLPLRPTVDGLHDMQLDAVVAWNEPDYLAYAPAGALRVVDQQLNDWGYCKVDPTRNADLFVYPSDSSRLNHVTQLAKHESDVVANSVDLDLFAGDAPARHPRRVVYCSSPDRGLHHLLAMWPAVRARVPDAELKIFYRIEPWFAANLLNPSEVGDRARYIEAAFARLDAAAPGARPSRWGVEVVGPVSNREMARQLRSATVLVYPCDPVRYTEGFGCSVLDACAAGCLPIVSDADAFPEVHGAASLVVKGRPGDAYPTWVDRIVECLNETHDDFSAMAAHAERHSRQKIAEQWERLLLSHRRTGA